MSILVIAEHDNDNLKGATLNTIADKAFTTIKNELSGDAYIAKGELEQARAAYQAALDAAGEQVSSDLRMKFDDLTPAV